MNHPLRLTFATAALATLGAFTTGCASITDGTTQTVVFHLTPKEARCIVSREGSQLGIVSGKQNTITIDKGAKDVLVQCSAPGYENTTQRLVSKTQTSGVVGGFFLDLGITDMVTGAMWKYPNEITIVMEQSVAAEEAPAERSPAPRRRAARAG